VLKRGLSTEIVSKDHSLNIVLIVGSAPDAIRIKDWELSELTSCVVINNAWQLIDHWDYLIYPEDFPIDRLPSSEVLAQKNVITAKEFVPEQNHFGGFVYAGGTMAFTAGYWALGALKPDVIAYLGCDMVYPRESKNPSHFYGVGTPDPLRSDITLQSLEAKSVRFMAIAQMNHCRVVNLSELPESRLLFQRVSFPELMGLTEKNQLTDSDISLDKNIVAKALDVEEKLSYMAPSGRYWEVADTFDPIKLREIDSLWLSAVSE
jgi:hypothetical protein